MPRRVNRDGNHVCENETSGEQGVTANDPGNVALEECAITPERTDEAKKAREPGGVPSRLEGLLPDGFPPVAQHAWLW